MKREELEFFLPNEIEKRSFEIISEELQVPLKEDEAPVIKRVIHTTADFGYAETLTFSKDVVPYAIEEIRKGCSIITDTAMGRAGINKGRLETFGGRVYTFMQDEEVAQEAKRRGVTRASVSMEKSATLGEDFIYAIGNAPTALVTLYDLVKSGKIHPKLIIGVPVGFVNVVEAKELILDLEVPYIVARGRKGGSNVAAAICNALIYQA